VNVYTKDNYSLYEIDGEKHKLYAQNLSLFAKLFLDTKSVFYDVTTFLYYLLVAHKPTPEIPNTSFGDDMEGGGTGAQGQVVGFFSKEKMSWDNNNLACILVFPPWQKQGLGQILMGASYEMSRREERLGGPEKRTSSSMHMSSLALVLTLLLQRCRILVVSHISITGHKRSLARSSPVLPRRHLRCKICVRRRTLCPRI
jgi:GNAT superfamily N-acetyltransferase